MELLEFHVLPVPTYSGFLLQFKNMHCGEVLTGTSKLLIGVTGVGLFVAVCQPSDKLATYESCTPPFTMTAETLMTVGAGSA